MNKSQGRFGKVYSASQLVNDASCHKRVCTRDYGKMSQKENQKEKRHHMKSAATIEATASVERSPS